MFDVTKSKESDLRSILELVKSELYMPLIDSVHKFDEVAKAHHHFEESRKTEQLF